MVVSLAKLPRSTMLLHLDKLMIALWEKWAVKVMAILV